MTRVLLVDDHGRSRQQLTGVLKRGGYDVVGAASIGVTVAGPIRAPAPQVVLISVGLRDLDAIGVAQQIMAAEPTPIILLTSHYDEQALHRAMAAGVMGYLVKPLRAEQLLPAIELALAQFQEFAALRSENANLKNLLEARKVIEKAKGILMEGHGYTESAAFSLIKRESMNLRKPMKEIAEALILSEALSKNGKS